MTFTRAMTSFELHLRAERNLSAHTLRAYLSDVAQFAEFLGAGTKPGKVKPRRSNSVSQTRMPLIGNRPIFIGQVSPTQRAQSRR
jgi:site-specific recombinase XerD